MKIINTLKNKSEELLYYLLTIRITHIYIFSINIYISETI